MDFLNIFFKHYFPIFSKIVFNFKNSEKILLGENWFNITFNFTKLILILHLLKNFKKFLIVPFIKKYIFNYYKFLQDSHEKFNRECYF